MTHPERGTMTFQTIVETMAGHDLNHLAQLRRIAESARLTAGSPGPRCCYDGRVSGINRKPSGNLFACRAVKGNSACNHDSCRRFFVQESQALPFICRGLPSTLLQEELCAVLFLLLCFWFSRSPFPPKPPRLQPPECRPRWLRPRRLRPRRIDLPVRKVVLYKNGVGYFEHAGTVNGNQRVSVDFTSAQLNDVLQSLTALDSKGGIIGAVGYNSTMPIAQQLTTLALGLKDYPATLSVYQALRGQRVEVTGAGAPLAGRLVNVEYRKETDKNGATSEDHYFLIVETDTGALRTAELTDAVSVRMIDPALQKQFASYLEIVASAQDQQLRHLTLEDRGQGERQLQVSYISEVPVWKSTYRIVFPRDPNGNATVQGWAVVDNTVGVDWDNVQLSLVAGAPQSFIQPLSQPLYTQRPTIPIATVAQNAPITHDAAEYDRIELASKLIAPQSAPGSPECQRGSDGTSRIASTATLQWTARMSGWLRRRSR